MDKKELLELIELYGDYMYDLRIAREQSEEAYDKASEKVDAVFEKIKAALK